MKIINSHIQKCQAWIKLQQAASKSKHLELWRREILKADRGKIPFHKMSKE